MTVRIANIHAFAPTLPPHPALDLDPLLLQSHDPRCERTGVNGEGEMLNARGAVRRHHAARRRQRCARRAALEEEEYARSRHTECEETPAIEKRLATENVDIKRSRSREIIDIQGRLDDPTKLWARRFAHGSECGRRSAHATFLDRRPQGTP